MSFSHCLAVAILAATPFAVAAQEKSLSLDPADPHAAGASHQYESAFAGYRSMREDDASGQTWREANEQMSALGGHAGHIKGRLENESVSPAASRSGDSSAPQAPKAVSADHRGHGMRH